MKLISVVTPAYNEVHNVAELVTQVKAVFATLPHYNYEHIFIDNASTDGTTQLLKEIAAKDSHVKLIVNARNFGGVRSPFHGLMQARGDAVILMVADLQDPPTLIPTFVEKWEQGFPIVMAMKTTSDESKFFFSARKMYYTILDRISGVRLTRNTTGFGLYDRKIIETLRSIKDPYPYFRGLIAEIGFDRALIEYHQPVRKRGKTKFNFYALYDYGMLGLTSHSKAPLRIATMMGFILSVLCFLAAFAYLILKLFSWSNFPLGSATIIIGLFGFSSVQLFFIGLLGEYIGAIHTHVQERPRVVEKERVNFDTP